MEEEVGCIWYAGRDLTERDEAFRSAFGAPKIGGTGCSTGQILGVFAFHLPPWNGQIYLMSFSKITHSFRPVPSAYQTHPVPSRPVPSAYQTHPKSFG
ncbi:hypothetical protein DVH24_033669 [Malus domestica]|uniref:Uncharacterized protein n=1 Tax=Malus domestica TaxID=3750 RepID=A0A498HSK5_MALDO|nr:hypothetical protein DVH24_033669 [Malus domestica]